MRVGVFNTIPNARNKFQPYQTGEAADIEFIEFGCQPALEHLHLAAEHQCEALLYYGFHQEGDLFYRTIAEAGVKYICTHSTGYDHYNLEAMKKYGLKAAYVPTYSPNAIAEHTVMLVLSVLRHLRAQVMNVNRHCYDISRFEGREIRNLVFGVVGTGRIGMTTVQCLSGFGPKKIYAYDKYPNPKAQGQVEYVGLDELFQVCDVILFHCSYNKDNFHMVNAYNIPKMKDGVVLINTARGSLFDMEAVADAVASGKIGGLGLDVLEDETAIGGNQSHDHCPVPVLERLLSYPNVIYTPHTAYFTDRAEQEKLMTTVENLRQYMVYGECENELVR